MDIEIIVLIIIILILLLYCVCQKGLIEGFGMFRFRGNMFRAAARSSARAVMPIAQNFQSANYMTSRNSPPPPPPKVGMPKIQTTAEKKAEEEGTTTEEQFAKVERDARESLRRTICDAESDRKEHHDILCPVRPGTDCIGECTGPPRDIDRGNINMGHVPKAVRQQHDRNVTANARKNWLPKCPKNKPYRVGGTGACAALPQMRSNVSRGRQSKKCKNKITRVCVARSGDRWLSTKYRSGEYSPWTRYCNMKIRGRYPYRRGGKFAYCKKYPPKCLRYGNRVVQDCSSKTSRSNGGTCRSNKRSRLRHIYTRACKGSVYKRDRWGRRKRNPPKVWECNRWCR